MKLNEEVNPSFNVERGLVGVNVDAVRDNINILLAGVTNCSTVTPYIALERVRKVLAQFHIFLPKVTFMEGDHGVQTFPIQQFGEMMGMRNDGEVVSKVNDPYHLYFEYQMSDRGMFDVFCEIVNNDELEELLNDVEDEIDDEDAEDEREAKLDESSESVKLAGPETGSKPTPGAVSMGACAVAAYMNKKNKELNEEGKKGPYRPGMSSPRSVDIAKTAEKADTALDKAYGYGTSGPISLIAATRRKQGFGAAANYNSAELGTRAALRSDNLRTVSNAVHKGWGKTVDQLPAPKPEKQAARKKLQQTAYSELPKGEQEKDDVISKAIMLARKKKDQKLNEAKKEKPHKVKYKPFPGISPSKGNYDAQWKHSEKMNPYHATKQNLKAFKRFAMAEFKKLRKGPPNFEEYKKGYNKHQERLDNIIKLMGIIKAKEKAEKLRKA